MTRSPLTSLSFILSAMFGLSTSLGSKGATEVVGLTAIGRATIAALRMNRSQLVRVRRMWGMMGEHPPGIERPPWEAGEGNP